MSGRTTPKPTPLGGERRVPTERKERLRRVDWVEYGVYLTELMRNNDLTGLCVRCDW